MKCIKKKCQENRLIEDIRKISKHYGLDNQLSIAQEECAELITAISKMQRASNGEGTMTTAYQNLLEEIADVAIIAIQLAQLTNDEEIGLIMEEKVIRQLERMKAER